MTARLVSRLTGLESKTQENMLLCVCTKATEYNPVKLVTSHTSPYDGQCSLDEDIFQIKSNCFFASSAECQKEQQQQQKPTQKIGINFNFK